LTGPRRRRGPLSEEKRELKAAIATMDLYREQHQRPIHSLESSLVRYWPELTEHLELSSATLVALLARTPILAVERGSPVVKTGAREVGVVGLG
jgi:hypothetical protein